MLIGLSFTFSTCMYNTISAQNAKIPQIYCANMFTSAKYHTPFTETILSQGQLECLKFSRPAYHKQTLHNQNYWQ